MSQTQLKTIENPPIKTLADALQKASKSLSAVAARMVTPERLIKIAIAAAQRNPTLLQCTPQSIVRAVMQGAELGLTPGSALNTSYLVPFRNKTGDTWTWEAQLIVSAQGYSELAYRSGLVQSISAEVVYKGDEFEYELGLDPKLRHIPMDETVDAKDITHAYMVVCLKDGAKVFRVMTRKAIDRIRDRAPGGKSGPWVTDYAEMARKTVVKNGMKFVPKSTEVARAVAFDNAQESGDVIDMFESPEALEGGMTALPEPSQVERVAGKIAGLASENDEQFEFEEPYTGPPVKA